jgi:hypothetical protein
MYSICFIICLDTWYVIGSYDFEYAEWKLFQKCIKRTKLDWYVDYIIFLYVFIIHR